MLNRSNAHISSLILFLIFDILLCGLWVSGADTIHPAPGDWPMYGHDLHHSFANPGSMINRSNAKSLVRAWTFVPGDAVTASPSVVNGKVYVGSWDGFFYALDAGSGAVKWKFPVDCDNAIVPIPPRCLAPGQPPPDRFMSNGGLITSSAAVFNRVVYFGGGKTVYALRAADGRLLWKRVLCGNPEELDCEADLADPTRIFSSPTIFNGKILLGQTANATGYRGAILALRLEDGATAWRFEVDPMLDSKGTVVGGNNRGCGNVWASGAVDDINHLVVFGTSDCNRDATPPYHEAVLALDTESGVLRWAFRPRRSDTCNLDFGASANILEIGHKRYVGIGGKDGTYYLLRSNTNNPAGQLLWSTNVVFGGSTGGFIGSTAFDDERIYGGTGYGDIGEGTLCDPSNPRDTPVQEPSFHAFDLRNGTIEWERLLNYTFAAPTLGHAVVFDGWAGFGDDFHPSLRAYDAKSGRTIASLEMPGQVNSSATITGKMIFVGTGNDFDGGGSTVQALKLPDFMVNKNTGKSQEVRRRGD